jgi:hypothetical protein
VSFKLLLIAHGQAFNSFTFFLSSPAQQLT